LLQTMKANQSRNRPDLTLDQHEELRWKAHLEAEAHAAFPKTVSLNKVHIPLYKWDELASLGRTTLSQRAQNYRDLIETTGSKLFEFHRHLVLRTHSSEDVLVRWFIDVQMTITGALGLHLTHADFGAPANEGLTPRGFASQFAPPTAFAPPRDEPCWAQPQQHQQAVRHHEPPCWAHEQPSSQDAFGHTASRGQPCWSQEDLENRQHQTKSQSFERRDEPCWSQQAVLLQPATGAPPPGRTAGARTPDSRQPPAPGGALATRSSEAASIARRAQTSTIAFG